MKRVAIIGANSYIARNFSKHRYGELISARNGYWKSVDWSNFDSVLMCAAVVHRKADDSEYYFVNRDLAIDIASAAKSAGVSQFVFMSTIAVYGIESGTITGETPELPTSTYGKSKLEAERQLSQLASDNFKVAIVRAPMVYGDDCPGNYQRLRKLALRLPFFPDIHNQRSMVEVSVLCEKLSEIIESSLSGIFFPQNEDYMSVSELVKNINPKIKLTKLFNPLVKIAIPFVPPLKKMFSDLIVKIEEKPLN